MWQIADLHLARPQGLWASLRYPVQSDRQLGPADDTGRPRHRLHFEDDDHSTIFSGFYISVGCPVARVMSRDRSELRSQRADNTSGTTMCVLSCWRCTLWKAFFLASLVYVLAQLPPNLLAENIRTVLAPSVSADPLLCSWLWGAS